MLINDFNISPQNVKVVNLGIDIDRFNKISKTEQMMLKSKLKIDSDEKVILLYGRLSKVKGHIFLLKSLSNVPNLLGYKFKLIFPGKDDNYKMEIVELAKKIGIENRLIFPGYIDGSSYLSISDLMVLPSSSEGFGIVNIESFMLEVPVIRTKTGGYEDMSDLCFGIEYGDVENFSNLLTQFFEDNTKFVDIAIKAKENVARYSVDKMTDEYINIYRGAIDGKRS